MIANNWYLMIFIIVDRASIYIYMYIYIYVYICIYNYVCVCLDGQGHDGK